MSADGGDKDVWPSNLNSPGEPFFLGEISKSVTLSLFLRAEEGRCSLISGSSDLEDCSGELLGKS